MERNVQAYWDRFLLETNKNPNTKCLEAAYFGHNEHTATKLLALILQGVKTATTSCLYQYELTNSKLPQVGDLSIVTDFSGNPKCIIETTAVSKLIFSEMTYDICKREGEDQDLKSWRNNHIEFFTAIGKELGFSFSEDLEIIFEDFKVVYK